MVSYRQAIERISDLMERDSGIDVYRGSIALAAIFNKTEKTTFNDLFEYRRIIRNKKMLNDN